MTTTLIEYEPVWSDGHKRPVRLVEVTECHISDDGWLTGTTKEGAKLGPVPESWIRDIREGYPTVRAAEEEVAPEATE